MLKLYKRTFKVFVFSPPILFLPGLRVSNNNGVKKGAPVTVNLSNYNIESGKRDLLKNRCKGNRTK